MLRTILRTVSVGVLATTAVATNDLDSSQVKLSEFSPLDSGALRVGEGASLTLDLREHDIYTLPNKRPALSIESDGPHLLYWQFAHLLHEDPNDLSSRVVEATLDIVVDEIEAGEVIDGLMLVEGTGTSGGPDLATETLQGITIDTGAAQFHLTHDGSLLADVWSGSERFFAGGSDNGFFVVGDDGEVYSTCHGSFQAELVRNGPAAAVVEFRGPLTSQSGGVLADATLIFTAWHGSDRLDGRVEMRPTQDGSSLQVQSAHLMLAADDSAVLDESGRSRAILTHSEYQEDVDNVHAQGAAQLPTPQMVTIPRTGGTSGIGVMTRWPMSQWPVDLETGGLGWLGVKLWPRELALTDDGPQWSTDPAGEFVEFSLSVHPVLPLDLEHEGIRRASPITAELVSGS